MGSKEKNMDLTSTENEAVKKVKKRISGQTSMRWKSEICIFPMEKIKS